MTSSDWLDIRGWSESIIGWSMDTTHDLLPNSIQNDFAEIQPALESFFLPVTSEIPGLFGFSAYEVYQATDVTISTGGLLPHLFTITVLNKFKLRLFVFCGTICLL